MSNNKAPLFPECVLCLDVQKNISPDRIKKILSASKAGSVILYDSNHDEAAFQEKAAPLVTAIQEIGVAAIIAGDSRIAGRLKADGIHIESSISELADTIERHSPDMVVGFGNIKNRHTAMEAGELNPDYLMFGKLGADTKPEAHPRNIALASWWAELMEIPAIIQTGQAIESVEDAAATHAEYVSLENIIFGANNENMIIDQCLAILQKYPFETGESES